MYTPYMPPVRVKYLATVSALAWGPYYPETWGLEHVQERVGKQILEQVKQEGFLLYLQAPLERQLEERMLKLRFFALGFAVAVLPAIIWSIILLGMVTP